MDTGLNGALRVGDFALVVIHAQHGLGVGTDRVWNYATGYGIPKMIAVNGLDKEHVDFDAVLKSAQEHFGRLDILVNNAGHYGPVVPVEEYPLEEFDKVIAVHLRAAFLLSKLALPGMYARNSGVILNISSLSAKAAFSWGSAYAAAKAGLLGLTRYMAAEAARNGVRVNAICPGPVTETVMSKELGDTLAKKLNVSSEEQLKGFLGSILQGRGQTAMEIALAALFLCSDMSSAMVGQSINVDGGAEFY